MKLRSGLKLSMNSSTKGTSTTRPIVTRFGRFVNSRRRLPTRRPRDPPEGRHQRERRFALAGEVEGRRTGAALLVRDDAPDPAEQPRARDGGGTVLGDLTAAGGASRRRTTQPRPRTAAWHAVAGDRARLPGHAPVEGEHAILAHVQDVVSSETACHRPGAPATQTSPGPTSRKNEPSRAPRGVVLRRPWTRLNAASLRVPTAASATPART